ncbi:MAG: glycosyltransferase family 4 protein [Actinomycetes bacterium]
MKIRFLIANAYAVGGTIKTTYNTAGELAKRHDVEIVSVYRSREEPAFTVPPGVTLRFLTDQSETGLAALRDATGPMAHVRQSIHGWATSQPSRLIHPRDFRYPFFNIVTDLRLLRYIRSVHDGVLIGTRAGLNLAIARFARPSVVRIGQEHLNLSKYRAELREAYKEYYPRLDVYAALTEGDAKAFRRLLGKRARVVCVPNGVPDVGAVRSDVDSRVVIAAGRLGPQKGFDRLIPAWAKVVAQHPDWELRIFGEGSSFGALCEQIEMLGVADSVSIRGFTDRLTEEMAQASFYVMTSRFEGFPMVLLEAMGCGLPVVSFDCRNGPRDLITNGVDGLVVPNGDIDALADAISRVIDLGEGRGSWGEAALAKAEQYATPTIAARWDELISGLVAAKTSSPDGQRGEGRSIPSPVPRVDACGGGLRSRYRQLVPPRWRRSVRAVLSSVRTADRNVRTAVRRDPQAGGW